MSSNSGIYQLVIRLRQKRSVRIGRRGPFSFPAGYYVYTGSALRGLESRIARHLRRKKRMKWHIDYLLRYCRVLEVKRYGGDQSECGLSRRVGNLPGSGMVVRGFGSSDCKCPTHLFYFRRNPARELDLSRDELRTKGTSESLLKGHVNPVCAGIQ
jgi:sugar fermentation stimulation protein A